MFRFKRILEVKGRFIPQRWSLLHGWYSRDDMDFKWLLLDGQLSYCSYATLEGARNSFKQKVKIKIHKV